MHEMPENIEQSSDTEKALEDKRKEALYSDGDGRKTDFGAEDQDPLRVKARNSKRCGDSVFNFKSFVRI